MVDDDGTIMSGFLTEIIMTEFIKTTDWIPSWNCGWIIYSIGSD